MTRGIVGKRPRLGPREASTVRAMRREGLTYPQIAAVMGIAPTTVGAYVRSEHKRRELRCHAES